MHTISKQMSKQKLLKSLILFVTLMTFSAVSLASGGYGTGGIVGGSRNAPIQSKPVDPTYETGKSIFTGRKKGIEKLSYCVKVEEELLPVKRKNLKSYKKSTYNELAKNLYNCDQPDTQIGKQLNRDDFLYVLYYLNKRHRLNLRSS